MFRIVNLIKRKGECTEHEKLDYFKHEIEEEGRAWWGTMFRGDDGEDFYLTQIALEDLILNGEVFHSDPDKKKALQLVLRKNGLMKGVAIFNYMRFAKTVVFYAQKTSEVIRQHDYLSGT